MYSFNRCDIVLIDISFVVRYTDTNSEVMMEKLTQAQQFCLQVKELAKQYNLSFFVVTEGASAIVNNNCAAVSHAREAHIQWEKENHIDSNHDWEK